MTWARWLKPRGLSPDPVSRTFTCRGCTSLSRAWNGSSSSGTGAPWPTGNRKAGICRLAVNLDGWPIGIQDLWASDFARIRSVGTGSWITRSEQGHGYGTEARIAVLELTFGHLGAEQACTEYLDGNHASERVSRKLGYTGNGQHLVHRDGTGCTTEYQLRLDRRTWQARHGSVPWAITGLEPSVKARAGRSVRSRPMNSGPGACRAEGRYPGAVVPTGAAQ